MKKYIKALIYILNGIAGVILMFAFCMVSYESLDVALAMFLIPSAWLIGYGLIHDWLIAVRKAVQSVYVPDNYDAYRWHEAEQAKQLERLPECAYCGEPIQHDHLYLINGDTYCPECLENEFRKEVEDFIE